MMDNRGLTPLFQRAGIRVPLVAFATSRLLVIVSMYLGSVLLSPNPDPAPYHLFGTSNILLDALASRWDTGFYVDIASSGYHLGGELPNVAFFPLLPLVLRAGAHLHVPPAVAGLVVNHLALLGAGMLLYVMVRDEHDDDTARRALWMLMVFPAAFFGSALYTESLFLLGATATLFLARRGAWEGAFLTGLLTALTRLVGVLLTPVLILEWYRQRRSDDVERTPSRLSLFATVGPLAGLLGFTAYLNQTFGRPLAFVTASEAWGRAPTPPWRLVEALQIPGSEGVARALLSGAIPLDHWIDAAFISLFTAVGMVQLAQRRWPEAALVLLGVGVVISSGLWMSARRYVWVLFPAYATLARWTLREDGDTNSRFVFMVATSAGLLALFSAMFAAGYWVG